MLLLCVSIYFWSDLELNTKEGEERRGRGGGEEKKEGKEEEEEEEDEEEGGGGEGERQNYKRFKN